MNLETTLLERIAKIWLKKIVIFHYFKVKVYYSEWIQFTSEQSLTFKGLEKLTF